MLSLLPCLGVILRYREGEDRGDGPFLIWIDENKCFQQTNNKGLLQLFLTVTGWHPCNSAIPKATYKVRLRAMEFLRGTEKLSVSLIRGL